MYIYGLIGYPLGHSFSAGYFNEKFEAEGIDAQYVNFEIPSIKEFKEVVEKSANLNGLNVTIPYKEQVIPLLDDLDKDTAKRIGAVNVIKIVRDGKKTKLVGYNSDILGFTSIFTAILAITNGKAMMITSSTPIRNHNILLFLFFIFRTWFYW